MKSIGNQIIRNFEVNIAMVDELANFDRIVLDFSIRSIETLQNRLKEKFENERLLATATLKQLKDIRKNDSMRPHYQEIFNQCVVLLVSHFGSAVSDIFKKYVEMCMSSLPEKVLREELKFTLGELCDYDFNLSDQIGEIIAFKKDMSFQDMKSISRNFQDFMGITVVKDKKVNNIILGQACRHVIVHSGSITDSKLLKQLATATPRDLKRQIAENSRIQFNTDEIKILSDSMLGYLDDLVSKLDASVKKQ